MSEIVWDGRQEMVREESLAVAEAAQVSHAPVRWFFFDARRECRMSHRKKGLLGGSTSLKCVFCLLFPSFGVSNKLYRGLKAESVRARWITLMVPI